MRDGPIVWLRSAAFNLVFYLYTAIVVVAGLPALPFLSARATRRYARAWMAGARRILQTVAGLEVALEGLGRIPAGPVIFASKHQSALDTMVFHLIRADVVYGLKQELRRIPLFALYLGRTGCIFVDRGGAARALKSLVRGARVAVERGVSLVIFPEGTRRPPGAPPDYKSGVAALYAALGVPVVPVALNTGLFWPRRSFLKRPGRAVVEMLEPIPPGLDRATFMALLEERIETRQRALEGRE